MEFAEFILAHDGDDLARLALARDRYVSEVEDFDLALTTLEVRRKLRLKVPQWYSVPGLRYPLRLSGEQCSSAQTAFYKARTAAATKTADFASAAVPEGSHGNKNAPFCVQGCSFRIADLTGGLGVDTWAFSQVASEVLYNEMNPALAGAARHNFHELGVKNVTVLNCRLERGNVKEVLDDFEPDVIFLDPARRAEDGRKVFRLEDCQPDVLQLLPELFETAPRVLLKLSPMADITLVCKQLGSVREVHVVAADGECKELLILLERGYEGGYATTIYENGFTLCVSPDGDVSKSVAPLGNDHILFEPGKAMLKAGAFDLPCRYGMAKIGRHTHMYTGPVPEELRPFGKVYEILETVPLNNRSIKDIAKRYSRASVTARNIPLTSDQLRKKLGVKDGGSIHIFGIHSDEQNANLLFVCSVR